MHRYITKAQRKALKRVFDRCELVQLSDGFHNKEALLGQHDNSSLAWKLVNDAPITTYRQFRKAAQYGYDTVVMVHWCGMWLGIEEDGYTHS